MPTPVNHLVMAQELMNSGRLTVSAQRLLQAGRGPFLLGHTAPDVQTVSGQPRHITHFYTLPPRNETPAYRILLQTYPELTCPKRMALPHAAFLAGYLAHLLVDEHWWREVFHPFFGPDAEWATFQERLFLHNVLRTWLDRQDQARLNGQEGEALATAEPENWLPFVRDEELRAWRDLLVEQLQPGRTIRTAEVFATRMHVPPEVVETAARSPEQMARIFRHAPLSRIQAYRDRALQHSVEMINWYLTFDA